MSTPGTAPATWRFDDPELVAQYHQGPPRFMPGHAAMLQMAGQLLAEGTPTRARILVVGAGGGLELKAFAERQPGWHLTGVDPAPAMLDLAREMLGAALLRRTELVTGTIDAAPEGPFDGASCLLTLHFVPDDGSKLDTLRAIYRRLKPGAPFVLVDHCLDRRSAGFGRALDRYKAFAVSSGAPAEMAAMARAALADELPMVGPEREVKLLRQAGFEQVELFYAGLAWRGWVARAGQAVSERGPPIR